MARFNTALTSTSISGTATIGSPGAGAFTNLTGTAPYTVTVPNPTLFPGINQVFYNATSGTITLTTPSGNFNGTGGNGTASMSIFAGNVVSITSDGTHYIVISEDGSALTATTGSFSGNVTMNGSGATVSITPSTLTVTPSGASTIDNVAIGSTTRAAGAFTSLAANAAVTFTANTASSSTTTGTLVVTGGIGASGQVTASAVSATNITGTLQTAAQTNITSLGTLTGLSSSGRYVVTSSSAGVSDVSYGLYSGGAWINSPTGYQGYLAVAGNGILKWQAGSVEVIGSIKSIQTRAAALTSFFAEPVSGNTGQVGDTNSIVLRVANTASGNTAGISMAASLEVSASNRTAIVFSNDNGAGSLSEKARITALGSLLVGNNPTQGFSGSTGYLAGFQSGGSQTFISIAKSGQTLDTGGMVIGIDGTGGSIYIRPNQPLDFYTNDTLRMRLDGSGNLGIATGSNALGYKLQVAGTAGIDDPRLTAINASIAATALNVFVYDTRKDSDAGMWRKRTQHTSWYNETLNTATRGSRKEFPAVAVMVITATTLTIYDGDDPLMPMWMVFTTTTSGWNTALFPLNGVPSSMTAVTALNGIMSVSTTNNTVGLVTVRFVSDNTYIYCTGNFGGIDNTPLSQRNTGGHTFGNSTTSNLPAIVNNYGYDCAMTVLPGAPIDSSTRLPTPTVAIGTQGGVTVIKDNGVAINLLTTAGAASKIAFTPSGGFISSGGGGYGYFFYGFYSVPWSATNTADYNIGDSSWSASYIRRAGNNGNSVLYPIAATNYGHANYETPGISTTNKLMLVALSNGIAGGNSSSISSAGYSLVSYITTSYNTGWMPGNIQGAWLSDSTAETVTGTELITNGTFTTNTTGWTANTTSGTGHTFSAVGGVMSVARAAGKGIGFGEPYQVLTVEANKQYVVAVDVGTTPMSLNITSALGGGTTYYAANLPVGRSVISFTSTVTTVYFLFICDSSGTTSTVDNVSVRKAELDRSPNGLGLQVYGSVTKTLLSAGSDLVAYSGWSTSNYLSQPYKASMDPTTGEYSVSLWIYTATIAAANLVNRSTDDANETMRVYLNSAGQIYFDYGGGSEYAQSIIPPVQANQWTQIVCTAKAGRLGRIYINGQETTYSYQVKAPATFVPGSHPITVGNHIAYGTPFNGSITMVRYSFTVPSNAQILKMYNDEKELFQTGAKACLYGTNDQVSALAYDDATRLLHVGTPQGRSVMQNLRRIENTTTGVSAAISASNGMIAEQ